MNFLIITVVMLMIAGDSGNAQPYLWRQWQNSVLLFDPTIRDVKIGCQWAISQTLMISLAHRWNPVWATVVEKDACCHRDSITQYPS